jgi:hypothetical protein
MEKLRREHEMHHRRRGRNMALLAVLIAVIALIFWVTIVKLGGNAGNPSQ